MQGTNFEQIDVKTQKKYKVVIGSGTLPVLDEFLQHRRSVCVTDSNVYAIYEKKLKSITGDIYVFPAGEESKNYKTLHGIYDFLIEHKADRSTYLVAVGGGVVGDTAGYAASTYMRGVPLVHVPTTLLAMVDSSIGGKTGINYGGYKNIIGSFYQPELVVCDIDFLKSLPEREFVSALAEVVKYGIIQDPDLFEYLEEHTEEILKRQTKPLVEIVKRSVKDKVVIVEEDERESGKRAILNFGHTLAHAIESLTHYERYLHGEAVSIGEAFGAYLSYRLSLIDEDSYRRIVRLLKSFGLPVTLDKTFDAARLYEIMEHDKKTRDGILRFVLTKGIGRSIIASDLGRSKIMDVINEFKEQE